MDATTRSGHLTSEDTVSCRFEHGGDGEALSLLLTVSSKIGLFLLLFDWLDTLIQLTQLMHGLGPLGNKTA